MKFPTEWKVIKAMFQTTNQFILAITKIIPSGKHTSSTAQGSGGSFKNRKPIGEVGGCESRMAARSR